MKINTLVQFRTHPDLVPAIATAREFIVIDEPRRGVVGLRQYHASTGVASGPRVDAFEDDVYATEVVSSPVKGVLYCDD